MKKHTQGYSLIEIAVVLTALGIILIGATLYWQQSFGARAQVVQSSLQQQARNAVTGFLYANYRLPCPSADALGMESCGTSAAPHAVGFLPWKTLGMSGPELGQLKYGVYRDATVNPSTDKDLATLRDRMQVLRTATPSPRPTNGEAPNAGSPPAPSPTLSLVGYSYSGDWTNPLNASCNASVDPSCATPSAGSSSVNMIDICLSLHSVSQLTSAGAGRVAVNLAGSRLPVAFVVVAPGLLDADANGDRFDGLNASATNALPTFEASSRPSSPTYDDQVAGVSAQELFSQLSCGAGLSAISHGHFNVATSGLMFERALYDYRDQLDVQVALAQADVAASLAGTFSAAASIVAGAGEIVSATGDTVLSAGARSFQIGLSIAATVVAGLGTVAAIASTVLSGLNLTTAQNAWNDFASNTTAMTDLAISINQNALLADAIGF